MVAQFTARLDSEKMLTILRKRVAWASDLRPFMTRFGADLQRDVLVTFRTQSDPVTGRPWKRTSELALSTRPSGGGKTLQASSRLLRTLTSQSVRAKGPKRNPRVEISTKGVKYAATHQQKFTGGGAGSITIKPRLAKKLAIPLTKQAARAGSARRWWSQNENRVAAGAADRAIRTGRGPRGPFIFKSKAGNLLIAAPISAGSKRIRVHFLLKDQVRIPQRRFLGWGRRQRKLLDKRFAGEVASFR